MDKLYTMGISKDKRAFFFSSIFWNTRFLVVQSRNVKTCILNAIPSRNLRWNFSFSLGSLPIWAHVASLQIHRKWLVLKKIILNLFPRFLLDYTLGSDFFLISQEQLPISFITPYILWNLCIINSCIYRFDILTTWRSLFSYTRQIFIKSKKDLTMNKIRNS